MVDGNGLLLLIHTKGNAPKETLGSDSAASLCEEGTGKVPTGSSYFQPLKFSSPQLRAFPRQNVSS